MRMIVKNLFMLSLSKNMLLIIKLVFSALKANINIQHSVYFVRMGIYTFHFLIILKELKQELFRITFPAI